MRVRQIYETLLSELNKVETSSILLEDFNYFLNKAITQYVNKRYNFYDTSQQTNDDLSILVDNKTLIDINSNESSLPTNYLHLLNCICTFKLKKSHKCKKVGDTLIVPAKKLTADAYPEILKDYYNKPSLFNPYFYLKDKIIKIECGNIEDLAELEQIDINFLRKPKKVILTEDCLDLDVDTSEELEFPDYVCNEIINELVSLVMINISDPRIQNYIPVNQSIASPIQQGQTNKK